MSTLASRISPIPLPSPTVVRDGWTIDLRGTICIQQGEPLPTPASWRFEYLVEETIDPGVGFPEQSRAIVPFYPKCPFYYSAIFIITFVPGWATVSQPTGFDALERAYEPADPAVFPPGAKQYIRSVSQSFPEGNTMRHEQEFITVPHWSLSPQEMATEAMDGGDEEATDGDDAPPLVSPGPLYPQAQSSPLLWFGSRKAMNRKKKQKKAQNKKAAEERLEREWHSRDSTSIWSDKEALDAWNAPSIFDSANNSNAVDPLPSKHKKVSENVKKSTPALPSGPGSLSQSPTDPLPSQHQHISEKPASAKKSSHVGALGLTEGSNSDPVPLPPLPLARVSSEHPLHYCHKEKSRHVSRSGHEGVPWQPASHSERGSHTCHNHHDALYDLEWGHYSLDRGHGGPSHPPHCHDSPPAQFEPSPVGTTEDRLHEGRVVRDEGHGNEKRHCELEEFSLLRKAPLPLPSANEAPDVEGRVLWSAVVSALNEISQAETESYVTQGALEEPAVLSYMSLPIPPFLTIPSNLWYGRHEDMREQLSMNGRLFHQVRVRMTAVHTHDFPLYLGEVNSQAPLNVYGPHAMNERNLQRLDFQCSPVAGSLLAPHYAFVVPQSPFSTIPEPEPSYLVYNSSSPALCRVNDNWIANRTGPRSHFGCILDIASTMVNHLHALHVTPHAPSDHSFSALDEASKRVRSADAELHRLMVFAMLDDVRNTVLYMEWTIALSLAVARILFFVGGMVGMQAENLRVEFHHFLQMLERWGVRHWCVEADRAGSRFKMDPHSTPTNDVRAEENHQSFLFQWMDSTGDRKRTAWVTCEKLTAPVPFLIPPPPGPTWAWDVMLQQNLASLVLQTLDLERRDWTLWETLSGPGNSMKEGLHPPSSGKRRWYHMWTPLLMGNHLPAQQALIFVPPSYHEQRRMVPSLLGIGAETLNVSADLFSTNDERTPEVLPDVWYGLLVEPFVTEMALLSMVDVVQSRGAEGWKQTHLGKKGLALRVIFKSLANRDEVYRLLKEDEKFSLVVAADLPACFNSWLPYRMVREPGYIQYLWKYSCPLAVHGTLMGLVPPSRSLPPSEPDYEFACERERCHQTLIMADLLETGKYPAVVCSQGPDPPKCAYLPVYPAVSGPYVKLLRFIASQVEFAAQSNHMQCKFVPLAQSKKLNVRQLTEAVGYRLDSKRFFIDWDSSSPMPPFIPTLLTLEADRAQSEDRVNDFRSSKAKRKGKKVDPIIDS
ncbi:hypothetical protein BS47DRAFT_1368416 [Hydnum rufescens UP504]|uniref:Uncharacterized protein n=1 Tax=Hydnum rufescens UP504 TaxID=1448309 RepID=A0A9P6DK63_9AGAM|nr:hypothetical protein BS47DRAFT_1368416 [Hydnum rufescens UP504]